MGGRAHLAAALALLLGAAAARAQTAPRAVPVNLSLVPGLSTNDLFAGPVENSFAFGLLATRSQALRGVALGAMGTWVDGDVSGVQVGVAGNVTLGAVHGLQLAGVANLAGDLTGVQVGVVNVAARVRGVQLGVINVTDDPDAVSLGFFTLVRGGGGRFEIEAFASDQQPVNISIKTGTRVTHSFAFIGSGREDFLLLGGGLGFHFGDALWLEIDATYSLNQALTQLYAVGVGAETEMLAGVRLGLGWRIFPHFSIFVRPTFNYAVSFGPNVILRNSYLPPLVRIETPESGGGGHQLWLGLQIGFES